MSKLRPDSIKFDEHDFFVGSKDSARDKSDKNGLEAALKEQEALLAQKKAEIIAQAQAQAAQILEDAETKSAQILSDAQTKADETIQKANEEAQKLKTDSEKEAQDEIQKAKDESDSIRAQSAREGYEEGHKDGLEKIREELDEKIQNFDNFCKTQFEIKEKILNSLNNDFLDIINNISRKVLIKELNGEALDKIIKATVSKLEKKENATVILSEKYARLLYEFQNNKLEENDIENENNELSFENFNKYENFKIIRNPKLAPDTIIVENFKERFDSSISSQLDIIIRDIYEAIESSSEGRMEFESPNNETEEPD